MLSFPKATMPSALNHVRFYMLWAFVAISVGEYTGYEEIYNNELFPRGEPQGPPIHSGPPMYSYFSLPRPASDAEELEGRQLFRPINPNNQGLFTRNPFGSILNRLPFIKNPDFAGLLSTYDSCKAPSGEFGLCLAAAACTIVGGKASGSCNIGSVCCVNSVAKCSGTITMNNTYWQSPAMSIPAQSTCSVGVRLDQTLPEQKKMPICQVRLDFVSFTIAQPNDQTVCNTDTFQARGANNKAPVICGDNNEQHMYLHVQESNRKATELQLIFNFGTGVTPRNWNIKVSMIPCGATYAAPSDCLQYFTGASGTVKSFNWIDTTVTATRQLANQDYSICFRTEVISAQRATGICFQPCTTTAPSANAFRLSLVITQEGNEAVGGPAPVSAKPYIVTGDDSQGPFKCVTDYLTISNGQDPNKPVAPTNNADRYCGGKLNADSNAGASAHGQVCSSARPFKIIYRTDEKEVIIIQPSNTPTFPAVPSETTSVGFCLTYVQRLQ